MRGGVGGGAGLMSCVREGSLEPPYQPHAPAQSEHTRHATRSSRSRQNGVKSGQVALMACTLQMHQKNHISRGCASISLHISQIGSRSVKQCFIFHLQVGRTAECLPEDVASYQCIVGEGRTGRFLRGLRRMFKRRGSGGGARAQANSSPDSKSRSTSELLDADRHARRKEGAYSSGLSVSHDSVFTGEPSGDESSDDRPQPPPHHLPPSHRVPLSVSHVVIQTPAPTGRTHGQYTRRPSRQPAAHEPLSELNTKVCHVIHGTAIPNTRTLSTRGLMFSKKLAKSMSDHAHYRVPKPLLQRNVLQLKKAVALLTGCNIFHRANRGLEAHGVAPKHRTKNPSGRGGASATSIVLESLCYYISGVNLNRAAAGRPTRSPRTRRTALSKDLSRRFLMRISVCESRPN
ncbi:hypothetical protein EVAR_54765_1 [Eumeta japonica]|uniref:Uncharacterized protein n=1 Tax=Eumeta variegata TaxID=151549 RepID=A0A4C1YAC1_EUMVA|nr:hypothetical protein EVAR_54765_1 [Eumeta japonica]